MIQKLLLLYLLFLVFACRREADPVQKKQAWSDAASVNYNQELSVREELKIQTFLAHYTDLKMHKTSSGLRYFVYQTVSTQAPIAKEGQQAVVQLSISLLDGRQCYQTKADEVERFTIAKSEKESGIHEAVQYMRVGERAKLLLPSYLGHGLLGDRAKIPPQSILYIDIYLKAIE
jgi:FKBP-type peptidyl-prolyl cis-trans isomerase